MILILLKGTEGRMGKYLSLVNYQANPITSAMFITATAPNPLVVDLVAKATNSEISLLEYLGTGNVAAGFDCINYAFDYVFDVSTRSQRNA